MSRSYATSLGSVVSGVYLNTGLAELLLIFTTELSAMSERELEGKDRKVVFIAVAKSSILLRWFSNSLPKVTYSVSLSSSDDVLL